MYWIEWGGIELLRCYVKYDGDRMRQKRGDECSDERGDSLAKI